MLKKILIGVGLVILGFAGYVGYIMLTTRSHSPAATAEYNQDGLKISINYCQPYKKERLIFGEESEGALLKYGKYWRLGANEATEVSFNRDVTVAGQPLKAGTYRFYAFPEKDKWTLGFNSELGEWGAFPPNYDLDVLRVEAKTTITPNVTEQFTIEITNQNGMASIDMMWDKTKVSLPIK